jgi:hypothetical protein
MENKIKLLITTGDSATAYPAGPWTTWPKHLADVLNCEVVYGGQGATGDGMISRYTIFHVIEALKKYKPEEILVGVMWGAASVFEMFSTKEIPHRKITKHPYGNYRNPISVAGSDDFYIVHPYWKDATSLLWYDKYYDPTGARILALEHILRTQWFLEKHKISYFMSEAYIEGLPEDEYLQNADVKFLYDQVDLSKFINQNDKKTFQQWCVTESGIPLPYENDPHPNSESHRLYTERVILPHLKKEGII